MNQKGGAIELFVMLLLGLLATGFFLVFVNKTTYPLTQSSTWSGDGTTSGLLLGAVGIIMLLLVFFYAYKGNPTGATNY